MPCAVSFAKAFLVFSWLVGCQAVFVFTLLRQSEIARDWAVGSYCSGTDCALTVFQCFFSVAGRVLNICPEDMPCLRHAFSCEINENKQTFLKEFCPEMESLYKDALEESVEESADLVTAGFPCDDASQLHPKSSSAKHRMCVSQARKHLWRDVLGVTKLNF